MTAWMVLLYGALCESPPSLMLLATWQQQHQHTIVTVLMRAGPLSGSPQALPFVCPPPAPPTFVLLLLLLLLLDHLLSSLLLFCLISVSKPVSSCANSVVHRDVFAALDGGALHSSPHRNRYFSVILSPQSSAACMCCFVLTFISTFLRYGLGIAPHTPLHTRPLACSVSLSTRPHLRHPFHVPFTAYRPAIAQVEIIIRVGTFLTSKMRRMKKSAKPSATKKID